VWLKAKVSECRLGLRMYVSSVCDAQRRYSCSLRLVALFKCYAFTFVCIEISATVISIGISKNLCEECISRCILRELDTDLQLLCFIARFRVLCTAL